MSAVSESGLVGGFVAVCGHLLVVLYHKNLALWGVSVASFGHPFVASPPLEFGCQGSPPPKGRSCGYLWIFVNIQRKVPMCIGRAWGARGVKL